MSLNSWHGSASGFIPDFLGHFMGRFHIQQISFNQQQLLQPAGTGRTRRILLVAVLSKTTDDPEHHSLLIS